MLTLNAAIARIAATSPEYEGSTGFLECPYCDGMDDGQEWTHEDDCAWLVLARNATEPTRRERAAALLTDTDIDGILNAAEDR